MIRWSFTLIAGLLAASIAAAQGVASSGPSKAQMIVQQVCAACHAQDGNSAQPANPVIAGQHADYTLKQLMNFKAHDGRPAERANPVMAGMVASLSQEDMQNLAAYFGAQKIKPRAAHDAELVQLGQSLYRGGKLTSGVAACTACHGPNGAGVPAQFPRLAGQFPEYIALQLKAFRSGERANDANRMMRAIAEKLSDREIAALAEYIAGLR